MTALFPDELADRLRRYDQLHLLRWWGELTEAQRRLLTTQIEAVDFDVIDRLRSNFGAEGASPGIHLKPPSQLVRLPESDGELAERDRAVQAGRDVLSAGKLGVILVAGGQATRLGCSFPKGMYPIGPVSGCSLFQILAEQLLARSRQAGVSIPYYVMTSDATHNETIAFFEEHRHFGLDPNDVFFFQQGTMPAVDAETGRLLLADKGQLSTSPDGHGGLLTALERAGLLETMRTRGIEYLFYHQVDNPSVTVCDPAFLGFHVLFQAEVSTKVVVKRSPEEKMGVVVDGDGTTRIIEYSDLPTELASQRNQDGGLVYWTGSIAVHVFNRSFLERLIDDDIELPLHSAHKPVPFLDETGRLITPDKPNAYKFERFIFDVLPHAFPTLVVQADRNREFHPVKNAAGDDSPATAQSAMSALFRDWLQSAGAEVAENVPVEISPLFALDADDVCRKVQPGTRFTGPTYLI